MSVTTTYAAKNRGLNQRALVVTGLTLLVYLEVFLTRATGIPFGTFFDAIVLAVAALIILHTLKRSRIKISHLSFFLSVVLFTIISSLGGLEPSVFRSLASSIIFSKFIIVFFLARHINIADMEPAIKVFAVVHLLGCSLSLLFPGFFQSLLPQTSFELDTSRLMGFSLNANRAAAASSVLFLFYAFHVKKIFPSLVFFTLLIFSESRSLTLITFLVFVFIVMSGRASSVKKISLASIGVIVLIFFFYQFFDFEQTFIKINETLFGNLRYIRAAMLSGGWSLAMEFFPFGTGGGLFGSSMSAGSEAYAIIGISNWDTVIDMTGVFDSGIGSILGEYGFIGLVIYVGLVFMTLKFALKSKRPNKEVIFLTTLILFMSFFRTVASDFFFSFYFLFLYLLISNVSDRIKVVSNAHPSRP